MAFLPIRMKRTASVTVSGLIFPQALISLFSQANEGLIFI